MKIRFKELFFWLWASIIFIGSIIKMPSTEASIGFNNHFAAYFILTLLAPNNKKYFWGIFVFGTIIEMIQFFIPFRSFEFLDLYYNILGLIIGIIIIKSTKKLI